MFFKMSGRKIVTDFVEKWHQAVKTHDANVLNMFAPDSTFFSPVVHTPANDQQYIKQVLSWVIEIIEDFHYKGIELFNDDINNLRVGLVFGGKVKDKRSKKYLDVEGIDLFKLNKNGQITELRVMLRPLNATIILAQEMKSRFKKLKQSKL